jgi:hypothetical protein
MIGKSSIPFKPCQHEICNNPFLFYWKGLSISVAGCHLHPEAQSSAFIYTHQQFHTRTTANMVGNHYTVGKSRGILTFVYYAALLSGLNQGERPGICNAC